MRSAVEDTYADGQAQANAPMWGGMSGSTIKMVGIITMLIDHIGFALLARVFVFKALNGEYSPELYVVYTILREIGRLGFPIFCFLLVEGFGRTRNKVKYAMRLGAFALISEIPFDLALTGSVMDFGYQNVFFTLLLGFLAMCVFDLVSRKRIPKVLAITIDLAALAAFMLAAYILNSDYEYMGVLTIAVMYALRSHKVWSMAGGCAVLCLLSLNELPAFFALIPVALYNGKRGWRLKYFFYAFYPVHLFLLWSVVQLLGLESVQLL